MNQKTNKIIETLELKEIQLIQSIFKDEDLMLTPEALQEIDNDTLFELIKTAKDKTLRYYTDEFQRRFSRETPEVGFFDDGGVK